MNKRLIVVLIGFVAIISVAGCGKKDNNQPVADVEQVSNEEEADKPENEEDTKLQAEVVEEADANIETDWVDPCQEAVQLTDEVFKAYAKEKWQIAYKDILDSMYDGVEYVNDEIKDENYYLYDIDKDGIPELIIKSGADENDYVSDFYYWDGDEVK